MAINWKRRNYFVKPDIQGLLILKTFLLVCFCCVLYAGILALSSTDSMTITYENNNLLIGKTPSVIFKEMVKAQGIFILTGGIVSAFFAMLISHRFTGPLFKLERYIKSMTEGDHSSVLFFRPNDKGHELAVLINQYNEKISRDILEMRETAAALTEKLREFDLSNRDASGNKFAEAALLATQLQEKLQQYKIRV